jgi:flagellar basal-body rod modification protein FlgD
MAVDTINSANTSTASNTALNNISQSSNPSKSETDRKKLGDNFDDFLKLLTTQLKNQDPSEPLDTNEFTSQLVQFATVEQQLATNTNLEKLISMNSNGGVQGASSYIGKAVDAKGNAGFLGGGTAPFVYSLDKPAKDVKISIADSTGKVVFNGSGPGNVGSNLVTWDGKNSNSGEMMDDGDYYLIVNATGYDGTKLEATTATTGRVSAVSTDSDGKVVLTVGNLEVPIEDVKAVRELPASTTTGS